MKKLFIMGISSMMLGSLLGLTFTNKVVEEPKPVENKIEVVKENENTMKDLSLTKEFLLNGYKNSKEVYNKIHESDNLRLDEQIANLYMEEAMYWNEELVNLMNLIKKNRSYEEYKIVEFEEVSFLKDMNNKLDEIYVEHKGSQLLNLMKWSYMAHYKSELCNFIANKYL